MTNLLIIVLSTYLFLMLHDTFIEYLKIKKYTELINKYLNFNNIRGLW